MGGVKALSKQSSLDFFSNTDKSLFASPTKIKLPFPLADFLLEEKLSLREHFT